MEASAMTDAAALSSKSNIPVPDPSLLTTEQLLREIGALREILEAQIGGRINEVNQRFDDMDRALILHRAANDKIPLLIDEKIGHMRAVADEKFSSIQKQFVERDVRTESSARDQKVAVDAALSAAKEAVGAQNASSALSIAKSETATGKQIEGLANLVATSTKGLDDKIVDVKDRVTRLESMGVGIAAQKNDTRATTGTIIAGAGALAAVVSIIVGVLVDRSHDEKTTATPSAPPAQIIYIPAPPNTLIPSTPAATGTR
jgi:hypothetical protein